MAPPPLGVSRHGPGRVLLAEHARLIEPLARLATKVRRPLTQKRVCSVKCGCGMIVYRRANRSP